MKFSPIQKKKILFIIHYSLFILLFSGCTVLQKLPSALRRGPAKPKEVTLKYWGLWEPESVIKPLILEYQKDHPSVKIEYKLEVPGGYRERVQARLRTEGVTDRPDILRFHNTWLPMLKDELVPVPPTIISSTEYENIFYPVTKTDLKIGVSYYGIPLMYDGLALFYNEEIFENKGVREPPKTWDELRELAVKLTERDEEAGKIRIAGVALGTASNVDYFSDILGLMMLQNGVNLANITGNLAEDALAFYTVFSKEDKVWDETMPSSTIAFASGKAAMMFGPSWRVLNIKEANPNLRFKTASVPQLPGSNVNWASYWVEGVAKTCEHQAEAWDFLKFLSQKESLRKFYAEASKTRLFGEPYSRQDMAESLINEEYVGPYIEGAKTAKSWYFCSRTFDNGIDDRVIKYLEDAVNGVNQGKSAKDALSTANQGISDILSQFGL